MYSIGRRIERYKMLYIWKIICGFTPNCGITWNYSTTSGLLLNEIPTGPYYKSLRENSFHYSAPRLFNKLPRWIRDSKVDTLLEWKHLLDGFITNIPDQPIVTDQMTGLCDPLYDTASNSLTHWITYLGLTDRRKLPAGMQNVYQSLD